MLDPRTVRPLQDNHFRKEQKMGLTNHIKILNPALPR